METSSAPPPGAGGPPGAPPFPTKVSDIFPSPDDDFRNISTEVLALHIFMPVFSALFVIGRIYVRAWMTPAFGFDDVLLIAGYLFCIANDIMICIQTRYGLGWPINDILMWQMFQFQKMMYFSPPLFLIAGACVKASLIHMYSRLAVERWSKIACTILQVVNVLFWLCFSCAAFFGCKPIPFFWDKTITITNPNAKCIDYPLMYRIQGALNIVIDFFILLVPAIIVWRSLAMPKRRKLQLVGLFALGSLAWIASLLRIPTFTSTSEANIFKMAVQTSRWSQLEVHITIIAACVPMLRRIFWVDITPSHTYGQSYSSGKSNGPQNTFGSNQKSRAHDRQNSIPLEDIDEKTPSERGSDVVILDGVNQNRIQ